ncbi:MAG TPA: sialate O-acetylesterase [Abditibacteriaceae bacterium]|jgi:sialate O-acetylesterase
MQTKSFRAVYTSALVFGAFSVTGAAAAEPLLHPLFSSNAVLQRDRKVPIWGEAPANTRVEIQLDDKKTTAIADANGRWSANIGPYRASLGHRLVVSTPTQTETRENIAFGDVWVCSGQSNMEWRLFYGNPKPVDNAEAEAKNANFPAIRLFTVPRVSALTPQKTVATDWKVCTPETVAGISAVGYFFGREIHQRTGIPIGLIDASWGGTTAQVWASAEALAPMPEFRTSIEAVKNTRSDVPYATQYEEFVKNADDKMKTTDIGLKSGWHLPDFDNSTWKTMEIPSYWEGSGDAELKTFDGVIWFRRQITLDEAAVKSGDITINLGPIDDYDTVYWNGEKIGGGSGWNTPRTYKIPASMLKVGQNSISIRVLDSAGGGGFGAKADAMQLLLADGKTVPVAGTWKYKIGGSIDIQPIPPVDIKNHTTAPTILFNGMISPLLPYGIKGALWYQGEANSSDPKQYETLLPALIGDWRARFNSGNFPFYIVQLAGFMKRDDQPGQSLGGWPAFRESQERIARKVKNSGIAVATDIGDEVDIHPRNKQDVGKRLAALALKNDYRQNVAATGPTLKSVRRQGNTLTIELNNTGGELITKGDLNKAFIIAGEDKKWAWAQVVSIQNKRNSARLVLTAPEVAAPVAVRFGWANFPLGHLYNKAGLPSAPFRSDSW